MSTALLRYCPSGCVSVRDASLSKSDHPSSVTVQLPVKTIEMSRAESAEKRDLGCVQHAVVLYVL